MIFVLHQRVEGLRVMVKLHLTFMRVNARNAMVRVERVKGRYIRRFRNTATSAVTEPHIVLMQQEGRFLRKSDYKPSFYILVFF